MADGFELLEELGLTPSARPIGRLNLSRGRTTLPITAVVVRELTLKDLEEVGSSEAGIKPIPLKEVRQNHHSIAKMLAAGHKSAEVSAVLGIGLSRISILQGDPAFQELLAYYQDMEVKAFESHAADIAKMLADLSADSISTLHERLLDEPEKFSVSDLVRVSTLTLDRTGHGPSATVTSNVTHSLDTETLERIRASTTSGATPQVQEEDRVRLLGLAVRATELHSETEIIEAEFSPSEGLGLRGERGEDAHGEVAGADLLSSVVDLQGKAVG